MIHAIFVLPWLYLQWFVTLLRAVMDGFVG